MEPRIDETQFGSVTIDGKVFEHDVLIRLGGKVEKRKKKLSKAVYGTRPPSRWPRPAMSTRRGPSGCSSVPGNTAGSGCRRRRLPTSSAIAARWSCCRHPR
jgi:hypothetical protein